MAIKLYKLSEIKDKKIHGRTTEALEPLTLFWSASGLELNTDATELWATVKADYELFEPWIDILVDNSFSQRRMLSSGFNEICLLHHMNLGCIRNIKILRDSPAMDRDERTLLQIESIQANGSFYPIDDYDMKIEFVGDSLTSGEGLAGAKNEMTWGSGCFNVLETYAYKTARALNAELNIISQSGWGVYCSWQGRTIQSIPPYYDQICGIVSGEENRLLGAMDKWDFRVFQPDFLVVNLGTNDAFSFEFFGQTDPGDGFVGQMRKNTNGSMNKEDLEKISGAVYKFLVKLREKNPDAYIMWCYGMMGKAIEDTIKTGIFEYCNRCNDSKVQYIALPETKECDLGCREHPCIAAHEKVASILISQIKTQGERDSGIA